MNLGIDEKNNVEFIVRSQLEMMVTWWSDKSRYSPVSVELDLNDVQVECILQEVA